jgi:hypothetical protein
MQIVDRVLHKPSDHFSISGILTTRVMHSGMKVPKSRVAIGSDVGFQDFDTLGVGRWRRQCFGSENLESPEE